MHSKDTRASAPFEWTPDFWQSWRETDNPYRNFKSQHDRQIALEMLSPRLGESILEIGCGYGWISRALWQTETIQWIGMDRSEAMLHSLRNGPDSSRAKMALLADATCLPFPSNCFHKVLCTGVLMHIAHDEAALAEMVRVLRPGGRLVCSINNAMSPISPVARIWNFRKRGFVQKFRMPGAFRRQLTGLGLHVESVAGDGMFTSVSIVVGGFSLPPRFLFSSLRAIDRRIVARCPAIAYEIWFSATKSTAPMRILKTVQAYEPFREMGGAVVKVRAIARGLRERGHEVTILTADLGLDHLSGLSAEYTSCPWGRQAVHAGDNVIYLPTRARYRALTFNPAIRPFLRENLRQFDLVHIYGVYDLIGPAAASACRSLNVPYVLEPMGMFRPIVRNIALKRLYHWIWGKRMAQGARHVIATSPMEATDLGDDGIPHEKIIVRRNGIEIPPSLPERGLFRARWKIPASAALILFLGRVVSKKSPDLLMEAFAAWRSKSSRGGSAVLVVAGPHEHDGYYQTLQQMASRLGLENHVLFTGPLFDTDKWSAYRDADVFALPSLDENFGNSAGESVAAGVPVILTDRCGIAPLLDGRGAIVISHDRDALRDALHHLLDNPSFHRELATACEQSARNLSWDLPLDELEALYTRMAAKPSLACA